MEDKKVVFDPQKMEEIADKFDAVIKSGKMDEIVGSEEFKVKTGRLVVGDENTPTNMIEEESKTQEIQKPNSELLFNSRKKRRDFFKNINKSRTVRTYEMIVKKINGKKKKIRKEVVGANVIIRKQFPEKLSWDIMPKMTRIDSENKSIESGFILKEDKYPKFIRKIRNKEAKRTLIKSYSQILANAM